MRSRPSSPLASRLSTQASSAAKSGSAGAAGRTGCGRRRSRGDRRRRVERGQRGAGDDRRGRSRSGDEGTLLVAGEHRDLAVGLDAHRHLGADQAQSLGADAAGHQTGPGNSDLRLRCARHDRAVGIAHDDVADAQRRAPAGVALELGAADLDLMAAAEIFLDRRGEPRRREIELDRAARQAPPQGRHRDQHDGAERAADDGEFSDARPQEGPHAPIEALEPPNAGDLRVIRRAVRWPCIRLAQMHVEARLQSSEGGNIRMSWLTRHAPTWRPLDRATLPPVGGGAYPLLRSAIPLQIVDPTALSRVSLNPQLTAEKGRKEGTWLPIWRRAPRRPRSSCRAMAAAAWRSPTSRAASS